MSSGLQIRTLNLWRLTSVVLAALAITLVAACAEATDPELTAGAVQLETVTPAESTPKPASSSTEPENTPKPPESTSTRETLDPVEAEPTPASREHTPTPIRPTPISTRPSDTPAVTETPAPTAIIDVATPEREAPTNTPVPSATATAPKVQPTPTATETPVPAPTPRPTPGPISRQTQFVPLDEPAYVTRENASANISDSSYVLGISNNGEARAYPLDMMWYHHIANDTVGGEPWLVTY